MKRKKKSESSSVQVKPATRKLQPKHLIIAAGAVCAVAAIGVGGTIYVRDKNAEQVDMELVEAQRDVQAAITGYIDEMLSSDVENVRVFDTSNKVLLTLNYSEGIPNVEYLPSELLSLLQGRILGSIPLGRIDLDVWSASHTVLGGLSGETSIEELRRGSLGWCAVEAYCTKQGVTLNDNAKLIVGAYLDGAYSSDELVAFMACIGTYGSYDGIAKASAQLFNVEPSGLTQAQMAYIAYAYDKANPSYSEFITTYPEWKDLEQDDFGFKYTDGDVYWLVRDYVAEELNQILGDTHAGESLNVSVSIDTELQALLQNAVDTGLRSSISLDSEGYAAVGGTVGVIDSKTGFITALIGGRSIGGNNRPLVLATPSYVGVYEAAREAMAADSSLTYATLTEIELSDGTTDYAQFGAIAAYDQLGSIGITATTESTTELPELLEFGASLYVDVKPRIIQEIQDASGEVLYTANVATDMRNAGASADIMALLVNSTDADRAIYTQSDEVGLSYGVFTSEYVLGMVFGTATTGYQMTFEDNDACVTTAFKIEQMIETYYPRVLDPIDLDGVVAKKVAESRITNSEIAKDLVGKWVEELKAMPINSVGTSTQFEQTCVNYITGLQSYYDLIEPEVYTELSAALSDVRISRTEELLEFAA